MPNKANRKNQANILISITIFIPKRFKKNGIVKINTVSDICDNDINIFECFTANESGNPSVKLLKNSEAQAFDICSTTPKSIENIKNTAIL